MKKHKAKAASRRKATKPPNDKALINHCVTYAQSIAADHAGYRADPDGGNEHAETLGKRHFNRAFQALTRIAATPATTPAGLCSKVRIVPILFEDSRCSIRTHEVEFLKSLASELEAFLQPICDDAWRSQKPAPKGGAS